MTDHTPGPWNVYQHFASNQNLFDVVGKTRDDDIAENCTEANARLIAAAPDLLAVLLDTIANSDRVAARGSVRGDLAEQLYQRAKVACQKATSP